MIDFFVLALQAVADEVSSTANEWLIEPWVTWNWGEDEPCPLIVASTITPEDAPTAEALASLVTAGALAADPVLDRWLRERWKIPEAEAPELPVVDPEPAPEPDGPSAAAQRILGAAETLQKIYLAVGVVITAEEARTIAASAGAAIDPSDAGALAELVVKNPRPATVPPPPAPPGPDDPGPPGPAPGGQAGRGRPPRIPRSQAAHY